MNILGQIFGGMGGKIIESLDGLFTSDEERLKAKNELQTILLQGEQKVREFEIAQQQELTKRQENDMKSDSWLSKNVRPISLLFLIAVYSVLAVTDGNLHWNAMRFTVGPDYIEGYKTFLTMAFAFYFGGRSYEKATKIKAEAGVKKEEKPKKAASIWDEEENW